VFVEKGSRLAPGALFALWGDGLTLGLEAPQLQPLADQIAQGGALGGGEALQLLALRGRSPEVEQ